MKISLKSGGMFVIYCVDVDTYMKKYSFIAEDTIVPNALNLVSSLKQAKIFESFQEASEFADNHESDLRQFGKCFFVTELIINLDDGQFLGYFGKDANRF